MEVSSLSKTQMSTSSHRNVARMEHLYTYVLDKTDITVHAYMQDVKRQWNIIALLSEHNNFTRMILCDYTYYHIIQ